MTKPSKEGPGRADTEFGTNDLTAVERLQQDMLACLRKSGQDPISYAGLAYCTPKSCGRVGCSEACAYGSARRQRHAVPRIKALLAHQPEPLYEVCVARPFWVREFGGLIGCNDIQSAKQLVRRVLDNLYDNTLIAVGTYKTTPFGCWVGGVHLIVAAHDKEALIEGFSAVRPGKLADVRVESIQDIDSAIKDMMNCDLPQKHPRFTEGRVLRDQRTEFFSWLATLDVDARLILYGCNREFNKIERPPRIKPPKISKPRPNPVWLERYKFGHGEYWDDRPNPWEAGFTAKPKDHNGQRKRQPRSRKPYYDDDY
jgi:hypothetical protein